MNTNANVVVRENGQTQLKPVNGQTSEMEAMKARIVELELALVAKTNSAISYKCYALGETYKNSKGEDQTGKGVLSMYGFGKFPISLYKSQALRLIEEVKSGRLEKAIEANDNKLAIKGG